MFEGEDDDGFRILDDDFTIAICITVIIFLLVFVPMLYSQIQRARTRSSVGPVTELTQRCCALMCFFLTGHLLNPWLENDTMLFISSMMINSLTATLPITYGIIVVYLLRSLSRVTTIMNPAIFEFICKLLGASCMLAGWVTTTLTYYYDSNYSMFIFYFDLAFTLIAIETVLVGCIIKLRRLMAKDQANVTLPASPSDDSVSESRFLEGNTDLEAESEAGEHRPSQMSHTAQKTLSSLDNRFVIFLVCSVPLVLMATSFQIWYGIQCLLHPSVMGYLPALSFGFTLMQLFAITITFWWGWVPAEDSSQYQGMDDEGNIYEEFEDNFLDFTPSTTPDQTISSTVQQY